MRRRTKKVLGPVLGAAVFALGAMGMTAHAEKGYTYCYDYWGDVQYSPDAYETVDVLTSEELGLDVKLSSPQGMFVSGKYIYVCDTGNNRILEFERDDTDTIRLVRQIDSIQGDTDVKSFNSPTDVAIGEDGCMYVADMNNNRVVKLDMDANYIMEFTKPDDVTFDQSISFIPTKLAVDTAGRVYCIATNVNKGLLKYENDGTFAGYIGATPVTYDWIDYIWKRLATQEQRAKMENFVPTEYDNIYMDYEGFIYACTSNVSEEEVDAGSATPIRRLNMLGSDILVRNGEWPVAGDLYIGSGGGYSGPSLFTDITAMDNDVYIGLDRMRGRLFAYDDQGRMLYCFGGNGSMNGYFKQPAAIEHMGHDLLVLDALDCSITLFTPTEYGSLIFDAIEQFQDGFYEESGESWQSVMDLNGNYDMAYIGIGRSLLRQKKYHEAMDYFRLKYDEDNYSKAYKQYRKEWVEDHIVPIIVIVLLLLTVPLLVGRIRKTKQEIDRADIFKPGMIGNPEAGDGRQQ